MTGSRFAGNALRQIFRSDALDEPADEACFARIICHERKRTERSRKLFLLMLLDVQELLLNDGDATILDKIRCSLSSTVRDTDAIGWHKHRRTLGILFTEIAPEVRASIAAILLSRVSAVLYQTLNVPQFHQIGISHHLFPETWEHDVPQRPSHPTLYPDLQQREERNEAFSIAKRSIDILGSSLGLFVFSLLFVLIALLIRLTSRGPVLFRQFRVGQYGAPFTFLKFRSMYVDNDPAIHCAYVQKHISAGLTRGEPAGSTHPVYKLTADPRITRIGAFLRKTSLDELPQLLNVLKGDMSLVGPRPAIPYEVEAYDLWHRRRVLEAKPGMTGLWQIKGRSRVTFDEMVRLDLQYATRRSLLFDLKILLHTPRAVIMGSGAC